MLRVYFLSHWKSWYLDIKSVYIRVQNMYDIVAMGLSDFVLWFCVY